MLGLAYKRDIDDLRESPSLTIIESLRQKGADVAYNDPYFPVWVVGVTTTSTWTNTPLDNLAQYDAVLIVTDHSSYDYRDIVDALRSWSWTPETLPRASSRIRSSAAELHRFAKTQGALAIQVSAPCVVSISMRVLCLRRHSVPLYGFPQPFAEIHQRLVTQKFLGSANVGQRIPNIPGTARRVRRFALISRNLAQNAECLVQSDPGAGCRVDHFS